MEAKTDGNPQEMKEEIKGSKEEIIAEMKAWREEMLAKNQRDPKLKLAWKK